VCVCERERASEREREREREEGHTYREHDTMIKTVTVSNGMATHLPRARHHDLPDDIVRDDDLRVEVDQADQVVVVDILHVMFRL